MRNKLMKKIPTEIIEKTLSETPDEYSEIEELAERWLARKVPKEKIYEKLSRHLISRGLSGRRFERLLTSKRKNFSIKILLIF